MCGDYHAQEYHKQLYKVLADSGEHTQGPCRSTVTTLSGTFEERDTWCKRKLSWDWIAMLVAMA